ncbi:uncharacterized protein BP5553_07545 [Venustampulla echinocandica]|uniref:Uncharacterized protein n=1 Tax=Venustampulla echinocandica TaxID=2656787 RepID=A0A370TGU3_9HELO|nr:uncharacterized protein BP5553_07545 [Venustampulla echinocandica]RDL34417.1 hypothetical protein BP5553_07545 [Venustampulla echinocandica]
MTCEKEFQPAHTTFLYCSEAAIILTRFPDASCRIHDQNPTPFPTSTYSTYRTPTSPPLSPYSRRFSNLPSPDEGPDIIPRASPTQSHSRSYFNSEPYPASYHSPPKYTSSPPSANAYTSAHSSTAMASLRELATALPKTSSRHGAPDSPPRSSRGSSSMSRTGSGVWNYIPFASSSKPTSPSATPGNSYTSGYIVSSAYAAPQGTYGSGSGKYREDAYSYGKSHGAAYGNTGGMGMDRPLPPRGGPGGYGHRPRSIDLVTPVSAGSH